MQSNDSSMSRWFGTFAHVGCAVTDQQVAIEALVKSGIRPFYSYEFPPMLGMPYVLGKLMEPRDGPPPVLPKGAWIGGPEFELQQGDEESPYWDFMQRTGGGYHHLAFVVNDLDSAVSDLKSKGLAVIYNGKWEGGGFSYFASSSLGGWVIELFENVRMLGKSQATSPAFRLFKYVALVVPDLDETLRFLATIGGGPFLPSSFHNRGVTGFHGKPMGGRYRIMSGRLGAVALEIIDPGTTRSPYSEFLETTGGGIHHVGFAVEELESETARLESVGADVVLTGYWGSEQMVELQLPANGFVVDLVKRG